MHIKVVSGKVVILMVQVVNKINEVIDTEQAILVQVEIGVIINVIYIEVQNEKNLDKNYFKGR